jgi:hypothetical protein
MKELIKQKRKRLEHEKEKYEKILIKLKDQINKLDVKEIEKDELKTLTLKECLAILNKLEKHDLKIAYTSDAPGDRFRHNEVIYTSDVIEAFEKYIKRRRPAIRSTK